MRNKCECGALIHVKSYKCTACVVKGMQNFQIRLADSKKESAKYPVLDIDVERAMIDNFIKGLK